jgi:hypothetical protein
VRGREVGEREEGEGEGNGEKEVGREGCRMGRVVVGKKKKGRVAVK